MPLKATQKPYKPPLSQNAGVGSNYTHIGIEKPVKRKIAILASVKGGRIKSIVGEWAEEAWKEALAKGLVTDAMIEDGEAVAG